MELGRAEEEFRVTGVTDSPDCSQGHFEDEGVTPADVLLQLTTAWRSERCAPVLLPHRYDLVDCMMDQISGMQENLRNDKSKFSLKHAVHKMELYRTAFLVNDYVRERLKKIESNPRRWLLEDELRKRDGETELLDSREICFAQRFFHAAGSMMRSCFLDELPLAVKAIPLPEDDGSLKSVFVEVKADGAGEVSVPTLLDPLAENLVNLERNVVYLLPYKKPRTRAEAARSGYSAQNKHLTAEPTHTSYARGTQKVPRSWELTDQPRDWRNEDIRACPASLRNPNPSPSCISAARIVVYSTTSPVKQNFTDYSTYGVFATALLPASSKTYMKVPQRMSVSKRNGEQAGLK
ncbi:unnamed protein product [Enterobius vermicularis]|uniref:DNA replication complex GINS protein SLD5 n=1 Tax=Enterobius vermicularis TaxID=51028 RepID=A0A0N4VK25_ENTVE|nr:unnamed protein product [Enterobius vermicularis]